MVVENPRQADYQDDFVGSNFTKSIFSSDPAKEKELAEYYFWLRSQYRSGKMTESQRQDYEFLNMKQNMYVINTTSSSLLTPEQLELKRLYGSSPTRPVNPSGAEILQDVSELPRPSSSSQGTTGQLEEVIIDTKNENAPRLFRYNNFVDKTTKYFYVLKDVKKFEKASMPQNNLLQRYNNLSKVIKPDPPVPLTDPFTGGPQSLSGGAKTTAAKISKLWYSQDYKKLYDDEIKKISLQLLKLPEMVLSIFDYETIDYVPDATGSIIRQDGDIVQYSYVTEKPVFRVNVNPVKADIIYRIQNISFAPIMKSLTPIRVGYEDYLSNFGHYRKRGSKKELKEYFPGYTQGGNPYYDIEITFEDLSEVTGYTIYLVEEDGII